MGSAPVAAFRPPGPPWSWLSIALVLWFAAAGLAALTGIAAAAGL